MLDLLALLAAVLSILLALLVTWGLDEEAQSGRRWKSGLALAFLATTAATLYAVTRVLDGAGSGWLAITAGPPLTMLVLLACDPDALWGNFPPSAPVRLLQRVAAVLVFALPGLLAWAAS